ncbi:MAG: hypothetical protein KGP29_00350 [Proteobacteria bacterium]|nr:hypothetical protein [Pseudomonadota bacterium]
MRSNQEIDQVMTENFQHKELAQGRWFSFDLMGQLGNIGSEVSRAINCKNKGNHKISIAAFYRALELTYLTVDDQKNSQRLREILLMREALCDFFVGENQFKSTDKSWQKYFLQFSYAARKSVQ